MKLTWLKVCEEGPKAKKPKTDKPETRVVPEAVVNYLPFDEVGSTSYLLNVAKVAIWQLYLKAGITAEHVELRGSAEEPAKIQAIAKKEFPANSLWLLPFNSRSPCSSKEPSHKKAAKVELWFRDEVSTCWVPFSNACAWSDEGEADSVVAPYWAVDFAKGEEKANMDLKIVNLKLGKMGEVSGLATAFLGLVLQRGTDANGKLLIQALTNTKRLKEGDVLLRKEV